MVQAIGQTRTPDAATLAQVLATRDPGQTVTVTADRGGQELTARVTIGELPSS